MSEYISETNTPDINMNTNQLTAVRIKEERLRLNYSQQSVADHLGLDISTYSRLENGKIEITIAKLEAIAEFFKVPVLVLIPNNLQGSVNITNGDHSCIGTLINNYSDAEIQNSLKLVIDLLQSQVKK